MSDIGFTEEQIKAIFTRNKELLVAASAGSGKTAVLVERIIQIITDINKPIDIDRLLIVTFTDAAAGEMRDRISEALHKKLEEEPTNEHLKIQIILIGKAYITTIHSFCSKILRKNYYLLELDPLFRVADDNEVRLLKQDIINELFENEYSKEDNKAFFDLVEIYGSKLGDNTLQDLILEIFDFVRSYPWPMQWLNKYTEFFNLHSTDIEETIWIKILKNNMRTILEGLLSEIDIAVQICSRPAGPEKYIDALQEDKSTVYKLINSLDFKLQDLKFLFDNITYKKFPVYKNDDTSIDVKLKEEVKDIRNFIKKEIDFIKKSLFFEEIKYMKQDLENMYPIINGVKNLAVNFMKQYQHKKNEKNILDFNDLEHFTLNLLLDENSNEINYFKSQLAMEYSQKFEEVLVDEYQDSNLIQELILSSVSKDNNQNMFIVGDIKQSIYKFRHAKPEIFVKKYNEFSYNVNSNKVKIDLSKNFRSRKVVLDFCNFLFGQLMSLKLGDVNYDDKAKLYYGADFPNAEGKLNFSKNTEVHIVDTFTVNEPLNEDDDVLELSNNEAEAKLIGKRINELLYGENKLSIFDKHTKQYRPVKFSDIVIISRSLASSINVLTDTLNDMGIPVFADTSGGYYESIEIMTVLSFLQVIDNPLQDIHIITVLHSPVYMLSSEELLKIRQVNKGGYFYFCIKEYMKNKEYNETYEKLERFINDINKWCNISSYTSISKLLDKIYTDTDYYNYTGVMVDGKTRQANLLMLVEKAAQFEKSNFKGLFNFIKYIEKIQKVNKNTSKAKILSENRDLVKIMTIHRSKGLEFPIVFFSILGKKINRKDEYKSLILHQDLGFGPTFTDIENRVKRDTIAKKALAVKLHYEGMSEELRTLYVALTRAKEKLILTGCVENFSKRALQWKKLTYNFEKNVPSYYMLKSASYLDIIMPCLLRNKCAESLLNEYDIYPIYANKKLYSMNVDFIIKVHNMKQILNYIEVQKEKVLLLLGDLKVKNCNYDAQIIQNFNWKYNNVFKDIPEKITISEIKRIYQSEMLNDENISELNTTFEFPKFITCGSENIGIRVGNAVHKIIEVLDLNENCSFEYIKKLIASMVEKGIILQKESEFIEINKIINFAKSDLADRIRRAQKVYKEKPFVLGLTPFEVHGDERLKQINFKIIVNGIIDCYFEENGEIVLVDFKSDKVTNEDELKNKYNVQLGIYKKALEKNTGINVKEVLIYSLSLNKSINILK